MTLPEYQKLIKELVAKHGFDKETIPEGFMLLAEEVGEFAKAARKMTGIATDQNGKKYSLEEEAADVFWMLLDLCNKMDINLEKAFETKEIKNRSRNWA